MCTCACVYVRACVRGDNRTELSRAGEREFNTHTIPCRNLAIQVHQLLATDPGVIYLQGAPVEEFIFIRKGLVRVIKCIMIEGKEGNPFVDVHVCTLSRGDTLGAEAILDSTFKEFVGKVGRSEDLLSHLC